MSSTNIHLSDQPLDIAQCIAWIQSPQCGGINVFIGTVRNKTKDKDVIHLEFEAYEVMAIKEMQKIAEKILRRWPVEKILIHHRIGVLRIGEVPVVIAVAAAHRAAAFEACRFAIDTLKEDVPIWKKEIFQDGQTWVAAHP
jgi:molybdopterin synthase catalytic subunit